MNKHEDYLFDPYLIERISPNSWKVFFDLSMLALQNPSTGSILVRPLHIDDYSKGFLQILSQLTQVGDISEDEFKKTFLKMKRSPDTYFIIVLEDKEIGKVIGCTTLLVEQKFVHECAKRGRIEDVAVDNSYRGKQLGKLLLVYGILLAKYLNCYKMSLDCKDKLVPFYESLGFYKEPNNSNMLQIRFNLSKL